MQPFCVTALGNRLWKRYVTAGLVVTLLCSRLWKRYLAALGSPSKLPKTVCNRFRQPL
jgi:hypothetical protein